MNLAARLRLPMQRRKFALQRILADESGSVAIEMACALFFLTMLILGTFEVPRVLLIDQKMERASASMADLVAQIDPAVTGGVTEDQLTELMSAADNLMSPYDFGTDGRVIISSIGNPSGSQEKVMWQRKSATGIDVTSSVGGEDSNANLPGDLVVRAGENIIFAEVFYDYRPLFGSIIYDDKRLYARSFTRPRFLNLTTKPK